MNYVSLLPCSRPQPFVSNESLENALETMQQQNTVSLLQLKAKHGFTNPAQEYNENAAFEYDKASANKSWKQTLALLKRTL
jgi:dienelactone hydrolase